MRTLFGIPIQQNKHSVQEFEQLWDKLKEEGHRLRRIIELGTGHGAFACYLSVCCKLHGIDFYTVDYFVKPGLEVKRIFDRCEARYFDMLIFENAGNIKQWIAKQGMTLLLCDDGDKKREYKLFAEALKPGDLIMAHDWLESQEQFKEQEGYRTAEVCEITLEDIMEANKQHGLERYMAFPLSHWCCFIKR